MATLSEIQLGDEGAARRHVQAVVTGAGTSFFWAMRFLPKRRRDAIFAVYAFCREVDDIADGDAPLAEKGQALAEWRAEVDRIFAGNPHSLTGVALAEAVRDFGLEREAFLAVIDGMAMDGAVIVAPSRAELQLYCARVASAVGLLCVRIFGEAGAAGRRTADRLGLALQLTNILRDLEEDAGLGRLYLPREMLDEVGIVAKDPKAVLADPRVRVVCARLAAEAERAFTDADAAIKACDPSALMRPAVIMMMVYKKTLARLNASGWRHLGNPTPSVAAPSVSKAEKLLIALRYGLF